MTLRKTKPPGSLKRLEHQQPIHFEIVELCFHLPVFESLFSHSRFELRFVTSSNCSIKMHLLFSIFERTRKKGRTKTTKTKRSWVPDSSRFSLQRNIQLECVILSRSPRNGHKASKSATGIIQWCPSQSVKYKNLIQNFKVSPRQSTPRLNLDAVLKLSLCSIPDVGSARTCSQLCYETLLLPRLKSQKVLTTKIDFPTTAILKNLHD